MGPLITKLSKEYHFMRKLKSGEIPYPIRSGCRFKVYIMMTRNRLYNSYEIFIESLYEES